MSKGARHNKGDISHERVSRPMSKNQGVFTGRTYVKKAGTWVNYKNYNTPKKADERIWE